MRLAVLSDHADQKLCALLQRGLDDWCVDAAVYRSEYEDISLEVLDPDSPLYAFLPEVVYLNLSTQAVRDRYYSTAAEGRADLAEEVLADLERWVSALLGRGLQVVVNLLPATLERHSGSFSSCLAFSLPNQIREINHGVVRRIANREGVLVNDLSHLAASIGLAQWHDERFWCHSKYPCRPSCLPRYADSLLAVLRALRGRGVVKCLVTDLDNTLWHGVIGDDGLDGIEVGGVGVGEAHQRVQHYLKTLKQRGIILCVCSKNEREAALLPFQKHSGMVLKEADFACFTANWSPKSQNIQSMASELNLGLDAFVFIDDSAFERAEVRAALPQVQVPELPEDPAGFCAVLDSLPGLEAATRPSEEDARRTEMYQVERQRASLQNQASSREEFLTSLDMTGVFATVGAAELSRAAQLIQRSNQFNLRTQRLGTEQLRALTSLPNGFACYCSLEDRFGQHGIIAVVCGEAIAGVLHINEWVMSCRVLGRGVEEFIRNGLVTLAQDRQCAWVRGEYLPTEKNAMVAGLYDRLGFTQISGASPPVFELSVDTAEPLPTHVRLSVPNPILP